MHESSNIYQYKITDLDFNAGDLKFFVLISDYQVVYQKGQSDEFHGIGPDLDQLRDLSIRVYVYKVQYHHLQPDQSRHLYKVFVRVWKY